MSNPMPAQNGQQSLIRQNQSAAPSTTNGQRAELGVWLQGGNGPGVLIQRITQGGAADVAGLREGDVVLQVNGRPVTSPDGSPAAYPCASRGPGCRNQRVARWRTAAGVRNTDALRQSHEASFRGESTGAERRT